MALRICRRKSGSPASGSCCTTRPVNTAYLGTLDVAVSPGVTATELRLASVVSDAVPLPEREAFSPTRVRPPALRESGWRAGASRLADVLGRVDRPTAVVAWLGTAALAEVFAEPSTDATVTTWFASSRLADAALPWWLERCGNRNCSIVQPSSAAAEASDLRRFGAWARSRGLALTHPRVQLQAYFALLQLGDALMHVRQHLVREYVLETIEHTAYRSLVTAGLPRLSLASGQRFASKGADVTRIAPGRGAAPPSWRVP